MQIPQHPGIIQRAIQDLQRAGLTIESLAPGNVRNASSHSEVSLHRYQSAICSTRPEAHPGIGHGAGSRAAVAAVLAPQTCRPVTLSLGPPPMAGALIADAPARTSAPPSQASTATQTSPSGIDASADTGPVQEEAPNPFLLRIQQDIHADQRREAAHVSLHSRVVGSAGS